MSDAMMAPPDAGAAPAMPAPDAAPEPAGDEVICTICKTVDGYMVYSGDEPEEGGADMSSDDVDAMGPVGDEPASEGQPADSVGAALKLVMELLQADASSEGAPGSADDQFQAGFSGPQAPTPAGSPMAQKY